MSYTAGTLTVGSTHTVATGVATTNHEYILALSRNALSGRNFSPCNHAVLLLEQFEGEMYALEVASLHVEVTWHARTDSDAHSIKLVDNLLDGDVGANIYATDEFHAFLFHEFHATVDDRLVELEVGDTEAKETARSLVFLIHGYLIAGSVKSVGASQTGRTGAYYSYRLCEPNLR